MINVIFFSVIELLCGFSPSFTFFFVMRALYGIGMGGEWGVGASLAMEAAPRRWRGVLSGILQSGYSVGYLLAAIVARFVLPTLGWRWMFWLGGVPALLALYIRMRRAGIRGLETASRAEHRRGAAHGGERMEALRISGAADGVHDVPFARNAGPVSRLSAHLARRGRSTISYIAMLYNVGAIVGAIIFGALSERAGRRLSMVGALGLSLR